MANSFISNAKLIAIVIFMSTTATFAQKGKGDKKNFLDNKKYAVQFYEVKTTGRGKALPGVIEIKSGKIESDLMFEKLSLEDTKLIILLDSTYTEDETEMRLINFEALNVGDKIENKWEGTVTNFDIEGTVVQKKGGLEKKRFEFSGSEKTKK